MAKIIKSSDTLNLGATESDWRYNALDCAVTLEVFDAIYPQLDEITRPTYEHAIAMQGPILEMECRGVRVDAAEVGRVTAELEHKRSLLSEALTEILVEGIGLDPSEVFSDKKEKGKLVRKYMWNSPAQLKDFFYRRMGYNPIRNRNGVTTDRKALEKLRTQFYAEPVVNHILAIRDVQKKLGVLRTGIDRDGRIRTSYNIAGTDSGRLSSYASSFGSGTNLQNITGELRRVFVADPGYKLCYVDLEQAEAWGVGAIIWNLTGDGTYLDFCESGDLHTRVSQMCFDELEWTDDPKANRKVADKLYYREFSYRDICKRLGHGSNYMGKPPHMANILRVAMPVIADFQRAYFAAFPGITEWHKWVRQKLIKDGWITTFMGRRRWFFGRRWEDETVRAAVAYEPQSVVADYLNKGLYRVWAESIRGKLPVQLLLQVHDAIVFQYKEDRENEVVPRVKELLQIEVPLMHGRTFRLLNEAMVGWNWGYKTSSNPDGLTKYNGNDTRTRSKAIPILDRKFY